LFRPDRPRTSWIVRIGNERVVAPLAIDAPDRVNRWQIQDIEPHRGEPRQLALDVGKATVGFGRRTARAWEELVPRRKPCPLWLDGDGQRCGDGGKAPVGARIHQAEE